MASRKRRARNGQDTAAETTVPAWSTGGRFQPLSDNDLRAISEGAFDILERIGIADAPDWLAALLQDQTGTALDALTAGLSSAENLSKPQ